ncbi:MAG: ABC transporter permease [Proteobacteria bacterium]|jgi:phospholipid/cholesterol/gamma-HCH transport system permease protein|nr:ABC transporter permease [Pseudomonadota bacterium]
MYKNIVNHEFDNANIAKLTLDKKDNTIYLNGAWSWDNIDENEIQNLISTLHIPTITVNGLEIKKLDTTGAYFIHKIVMQLTANNVATQLNLNTDDQKLFNRVSKNLIVLEKLQEQTKQYNTTSNNIKLSTQFAPAINLITFLGQICISFSKTIKSPLSLDWKEVSRTLFNAGFKGLFVVLLLNFLIGTTLAYEMAPQFTQYGANIYIINFLGISMLKEVSPLLTAIMIAGRTGSSITAEIGTMKIQEEVDAIKTMGISPIQRLVLPKVLGIVIATPLLTGLAGIVGMMGGAIIANRNLGITYNFFITRTQTNVSIYNFTDGLIKSVAFGLSIAFVSCFCGFMVQGNSNSIGIQTTRSVVLSILMIVFLDAVFAIIFLQLGI